MYIAAWQALHEGRNKTGTASYFHEFTPLAARYHDVPLSLEAPAYNYEACQRKDTHSELHPKYEFGVSSQLETYKRLYVG